MDLNDDGLFYFDEIYPRLIRVELIEERRLENVSPSLSWILIGLIQLRLSKWKHQEIFFFISYLQFIYG